MRSMRLPLWVSWSMPFLATELTSSALCQYGELTIRFWPGHKFREAYGQDTNVQQNAKC